MVGIAGFHANLLLSSESHAPPKTTGLPRCNFCCTPYVQGSWATHHLLKSICDPYVEWKGVILLKNNWEFVYCNTLWVCTGKHEDINFWRSQLVRYIFGWAAWCMWSEKKFARTDRMRSLSISSHKLSFNCICEDVSWCYAFPRRLRQQRPCCRWHRLVMWHCRNKSFALTGAW